MTAKPKPKSKPANAKRNNKKNKSFKTKTDDFTRSPEYWEAYDNAKAELSRENEVKKLDRQLGQHTVIDNGGNGKADQNQNQKKLPVFSTYKYSKPVLHEAVIIDGLPFFLKYDAANDKLLTVEKIEESSRILRPPGREEYQYTPYEFANAEQLQQYIEVTKKETKDLLYQKAKYLVKKYNDQDDYKLNLLAIDIIWSYFQDKFATTHYLGITGENEGGKSSVGNTFEGTGYRVLNMTSPTAANVFRTLGIIEAGQCTLVLDESERISDDPDIMAILRSGYDFSKKIPKTNTNSWKQEWFFTYCMKVMIAEKSPNKLKAKGLLDRTLLFSVFPGDAKLDIKEVMNSNERAPHLQRALVELYEFRKLMLVYRLIHFDDFIPDLDVGVKRRDKELCKPYIRLFYESKAQNEVEKTFQVFLDAKNARKSTSIEAILVPVMIDLIEERGSRVYSAEIWDYIKANLEGTLNPEDPNEYFVAGYSIYRNTITKILEDKFGADPPRHTNKGNEIVLHLDKLQKLERVYSSEAKIKTSLINVIEDDGEGSEGSEGSWEGGMASKDVFLDKNVQNGDKNNGNNVNISQNEALEGLQTPPSPSYMPSQPSLPSLSEEEKAAARAKYEELSRAARKESENATKKMKELSG